jgi:tetratricopeptide (TPR) repeat protein
LIGCIDDDEVEAIAAASAMTPSLPASLGKAIETISGQIAGHLMPFTKYFFEATCAGLIGMAAACVAIPASADDGAICVRGSGDVAIDACTRALNSGRYDGRNLAIIYSNRANQHERKGEYDKALADHNQAIRTDPTYAAGYMHRGNTYARHGEFDRAIADQSEAIRLNPKDAEAFYNRGYTYSHKGDHERAIADYTTGIELDANNSRLWGQRCWSRAVVGKQLQEALVDCNKAKTLSPTIPQIIAYRGLVYLRLGQFDKAIADYDVAFKMTKFHNHADWLYGRGIAKLRKGDAAGGDADIKSAKTIKTDIAEEYAKYGIK